MMKVISPVLQELGRRNRTFIPRFPCPSLLLASPIAVETEDEEPSTEIMLLDVALSHEPSKSGGSSMHASSEGFYRAIFLLGEPFIISSEDHMPDEDAAVGWRELIEQVFEGSDILSVAEDGFSIIVVTLLHAQDPSMFITEVKVHQNGAQCTSPFGIGFEGIEKDRAEPRKSILNTRVRPGKIRFAESILHEIIGGIRAGLIQVFASKPLKVGEMLLYDLIERDVMEFLLSGWG
jgi:hypothetical protein